MHPVNTNLSSELQTQMKYGSHRGILIAHYSFPYLNSRPWAVLALAFGQSLIFHNQLSNHEQILKSWKLWNWQTCWIERDYRSRPMTSVVSLYVICCSRYVNHHKEYRYDLPEKKQILGYYISLRWNNKINIIKTIDTISRRNNIFLVITVV